jgi:hypothetical protein
MRQILFRGKRKDNGEWVVGHLLTDVFGVGLYIQTRTGKRFKSFEIAPETVGQYTGLSAWKSCRGTKPEDLMVFEEDIVVFNFPYNPKDKGKRKIIFEEGAFQAIRSGGYVSLSRNFPFLNSETLDAEIIGNIHDDKNILEGTE